MSNLNLGHSGTNMNVAYKTYNNDTQYDMVFGKPDNAYNPAIVAISSEDRDMNKYPDIAEYSIDLSESYREITSIELVLADIPNTGYVVEDTRNLLHFQDTQEQIDNDSYYTIELPIGNYPIDADSGLSIRKNIEDMMTAASSNGSIYEVSINNYTNIITIEQTSGSQIFSLLFEGRKENHDGGKKTTKYKERSIGPMLGFKQQNYTGDLVYSGLYSYNLTIDNYIVMFVNSYGRVDSNNSNIKDAFCIIPLDTTINNFSYAKNCDFIRNDRYIKVFSSVKPDLNKVKIRFTDPRGNLYNFNGHDHILMFEISSRTRNGKYT